MLLPGLPYLLLLLITVLQEVRSDTCVYPDSRAFSECPAAEQYKKRGETAVLFCARKSAISHCMWSRTNDGSNPSEMMTLSLKDGQQHNKYKKYNDGRSGNRSCNLEIIGVEDLDSGTWTCHATVNSDGVTIPTVSGKIIVPHPPQPPVIQTSEGSSMANQVEVNQGTHRFIQCVVRNGRPPARISWYIDKENVTERAAGKTLIEAHDDNLYTASRRLYWSKIPQLWRYNGRTLTCRADHMSYSHYASMKPISLKVMFPPKILSSDKVKYVPIPGSPTSVTVHFAANPPPLSSNIHFHVTEGSRGDILISPGLVTSNQLYNVSKLRPVMSPANDQFKVTLNIGRVDEEVAASQFKVVIKNARGNVTQHFKIKIGDPPDPTPTIIAGVLGGIVIIVVIAICVIVIITKRKQARHRKHYRRRDERSDTESTGEQGEPNTLSLSDSKPRSGSLPRRPAPPPPTTRIPSIHYDQQNHIKDSENTPSAPVKEEEEEKRLLNENIEIGELQERDCYNNSRMRDWETESRDWSPDRSSQHKPDCLETAINCWFG